MKRIHVSKNKMKKIKNSLRDLIEKRDEIIFAYIHGSFLEDYGFRDIDIAVFVDEEKVKKENCLDYEIDLSIILEKSIRFPVDVKVLNYAPLGLKYEITKGEVILSRDEERRFNFIEEVWRDYLDFKPLEKQILMDMM
ncbi:MAG: nucleotidyltransferase domain-containing protein [Candidatus Hydrothermarchaeota archaeon]